MGELDARAKLLASVAAQAEKTPTSPLQPPELPHGKLHFGSSSASPSSESNNVLVATLEDLLGSGQPGVRYFAWQVTQLRDVRRRNCVSESGYSGLTIEQAVKAARTTVDGITRPKYLVVLKRTGGKDTGDVVLDPAGMAPGSDKPMGTFAGGTWKGVALVFDLTNEKLLGGLPIEARSSSRVTVTGAPDVIEADLSKRLEDAVTLAFVPFADDLTKPPYRL